MKSVNELLDLKGRVSLITGGAGHIGQVIAEGLAEQGSNLVLLDVNTEKLNAVAEGLKHKYSVNVMTLVVNLEDEIEIKSVADKVGKEFGKLDIMVNNAAFVGDSSLDGWATSFEKQSIDTWRRAIEVNLTAPFCLIKSCASLFEKSGAASIVNIGSIYGISGPDLSLYEGTAMGNPAAYAASKGGLTQLTRWLSTVLAPNVRVNTVSPGGVFRGQPESFVNRFTEKTPLKRMATEEDIKGTVVYLASDLSKYVTGQNIVVDGGFTVW
ncbi:SDR family oxidoreductase [Pleionea sediminis]|uniref:SDR family oxidoreductase n=1 Tax=Pleionea sediminis TaxID=2569479 RepID=UPI001185A77A|nr:SDR family oxidoreductase [Pleionea sediminis]